MQEIKHTLTYLSFKQLLATDVINRHWYWRRLQTVKESFFIHEVVYAHIHGDVGNFITNKCNIYW